MTDTTDADDADDTAAPPFVTRLGRVAVSIVILVPITVFLGYGGWIALSITAAAFGYDPETADGDRLRDRLVAWPERNRAVMRTDGRVPLPLRP